LQFLRVTFYVVSKGLIICQANLRLVYAALNATWLRTSQKTEYITEFHSVGRLVTIDCSIGRSVSRSYIFRSCVFDSPVFNCSYVLESKRGLHENFSARFLAVCMARSSRTTNPQIASDLGPVFPQQINLPLI